MNNEVEKLEEKIQCLEESIIEFENSHIKQVNDLINLFSDVIGIIKDKKEEEAKGKVLIGTTSNIEENNNNDDIELDLPEIEVNDNSEFKNKSTKEIVDYIYKLQNEENIDNQNVETVEPVVEPQPEISEIKVEPKEEVQKPVVEQEETNTYAKTDDILKALSSLKIEDLLEESEKPQDDNILVFKNTYKVEKNIAPVEAWVNAFKNTDKWEVLKEKVKTNASNVTIKEMGLI